MMVLARNDQISLCQLDFSNENIIDLDHEEEIEHLPKYMKKKG